MKRIPDDIRAAIVQRVLNGGSIRVAAQDFGVSIGSVSNIVKFSGCNVLSKPNGRPRKLGVRDERKLVRWLSSGDCHTAVEASKRLKSDENINLSVTSVKRALRRNGLRGRVRRKKPLL